MSVKTTLSEEVQQLLDKDEDEQADLIDVIKRKAEDGSESSQLLLGQYYLHRAETEKDDSENSTEAIYWLCRASRQGSDEATEILEDCLLNSKGITNENFENVKWCVYTPKLEKIARQAARSLYNKLNPLGEAKISKENYLRRVEELSDSKIERNLLKNAAKFKDSNEVSEEDFVNRMVKKLMYGSSTAQVSTLLSTEVETEAYKHASPWAKLTKYPAKTVAVIMDHAVDLAGKQGMVWLRSLIPTHQIYMLLVFFFYSLLSVQLIFWFLPLFLFYISFAAIMINTMQMFYAKRKQTEVKNIANMLGKFNSALDSDSAESSFSWNSLTPYMSFFVSLFICTMMFAMADKRWIPCSELLVVGLFFTSTCFFALSDKYDHLILLSIFFNFLSTMPVFLETFPYIPVVYHILQLFCGSVYSVDIVPGMTLNLGLPSLAYMIVPLIFVRMAVMHSWKGTYRVLIPHLVCFFWWQISVMLYRYSTWYGLLRASVGWVTLMLLLPLLGVLLILYLAFFVFKLFTVGNILKFITTIILIAIPVVFAWWAKKGFKVKGFSLEDGTRTAKIVLLLIFCISIIPMVYFITPPERDVEGNYIKWDQYAKYCSKPQWDKTNIADAMIKCNDLKHSMVHWEGNVKKVVLAKVDNQADAFVSLLPYSVADWLRCTYGEHHPDCDTIEDEDARELCSLSTMQNQKCHLNKLNRYTYDLWVTMKVDDSTTHDIRLEASDWFTDMMLQIKEGDDVDFRAMLKKNLGNTWPELRLYHIQIERDGKLIQLGSKTLIPAETWSLVESLKAGFFETWNFFMAPVIVLHT